MLDVALRVARALNVMGCRVTQFELHDLLELLREPAPEVPRRTKPGSRNLFPACGARTRTNPPDRCKAPGSGIGGRCRHHGGLAVGKPHGSTRGPRPKRQLVLFSGCDELIDEAFAERRERRQWFIWALPHDLYEKLPDSIFRSQIEPGYVSVLLHGAGVPRTSATSWPQKLGFRIVRLLAERGRIAFAVMAARRDLKRATRVRPGMYAWQPRRIGADELLVALRASGERLLPRAREQAEGER